MQKVFLGVDVSKDKLDISITLDGLKYDTLSIFNNEGSILGFFDYLKATYKKSDFFFGYEATSNYMVTLQKLLHENNHAQIMINPYMMSHYLKHLNSRKKTDTVDSIGISKYLTTLSNEDFKTVYSGSEKVLKKYNSTIQLLRKLETQVKNFTHSQKDLQIESLDTFIILLLSKITETKKLLEKEAQKVLVELYPNVIDIKNSIAGVGYSLLLELVPIFLQSANHTLKELQSFVGLSPSSFESGTSVHKKQSISKRGNSNVRKLLYMSAMVAMRFNPIIKEKYLRMVESGKNKMVALVACMAHLFRAVYFKFQKGLIYA